MNCAKRVLISLGFLLIAHAATAAPITDPNDSRTWQGAGLETFRVLLGYPTLQDLVNANILDDGVFPSTAAFSATFALPEAACGTFPSGIATPTYAGAVQGAAGYSYAPLGYSYAAGNVVLAEYAERGRCLDMWWIQDLGNGDVPTGNIWDLGGPSNQAAVFPIIDHGPLPQEAIEYSVYLSNNPSATQTGTDGNNDWVLASLDKVYLEGWIASWIADGFTTVWRLPGGQTFRYVNVVSGGEAALWRDGDDEIDTVIGLTSEGDPVCPGSSDRDGDGVCDDTDNCPDAANPLQEDSDHDGIGDACDDCSGENGAPQFESPTPECGSTLDAVVGAPVSFTVAASDPDEGEPTTLSASGVPVGAVLTPALPTTATPASAAFAWTPAAEDVGDHAVLFAATDPCSARSECSLTIRVTAIENHPPDCTEAAASVSKLWPPNHRLVPVGVLGVTDDDGDPITIAVQGVTQDEPVDDQGDGATCPDATTGESGAQVRAERSGTGNGRVYAIAFLASDGRGGSCSGTVSVCVPHDQSPKRSCVDDGQTVNSLASCGTGGETGGPHGGRPLPVVAPKTKRTGRPR